MAGPIAPIGQRLPRLESISTGEGLYKLAEVIVQVAVRVIFVGTSILMAAAAFPIALHAAVIPIVGFSSTFLASFFFPKPIYIAPKQPVMPPLIRPIVAQQLVEPAAVVLPLEQPRGLHNGGNNCGFNSVVHFLESDPQLAAWLRAPLRDDMGQAAFENFLAEYNPPARLIADFRNYVPPENPPPPIPLRFRNFITNYVPNDIADFPAVRNIQDMYQKLTLLQVPLANFFAAYDQAIQQNLLIANGANTQNIREAVHQVAPQISESSGVQEDVAEILTPILDILPDRFKVKYQEATRYSTQRLPAMAELPDGVRRREALMTLIPLTIKENQNAAQLTTMIQNFCNEDGTDCEMRKFRDINGHLRNYKPNQITRTILEFPNALRFQIVRFHNVPPAQSWLTRMCPFLFPNLGWRNEKIDIPVEVPEEVTIRRADGQERRYRLASFVNHIGPTIQGGHYTASRTINAQKYYMNDTSVTLAGPEGAERLQHSYLLCYIPV